jgi:hypothetical protein
VAGVAEAILKRPAQLVHEIQRGRLARTSLLLLAVTALCMLGYGLVAGLFSGGHQLWFVPLKAAAGLLLSALLCLPSLYVFTCLCGSGQSLRQACGLLLLATALSSVLLVGFAPIVWLFSQSTDTLVFMGILHLAFLATGLLFGLKLLSRAYRFLNGGRMAVLRLWAFIFVCVCLQMTTTLRPLVGEYRGLRLEGKRFFLAHWGDCLR